MPALFFVAGLVLLAVFQIALAFGAPLGAYAWGGRHPGALPIRLRFGSLISVAVYALFAVIALARAGYPSVLPLEIARPAIWVVFGYLVLGTGMNLVSRSRRERLVMTPVALLLAILALLVALGPS